MNVFVDYQSCIALSKNSMNHGKTKHFELKVHFVQNLVGSGLLELNYLPTDRMPADTLTRALREDQGITFSCCLYPNKHLAYTYFLYQLCPQLFILFCDLLTLDLLRISIIRVKS